MAVGVIVTRLSPRVEPTVVVASVLVVFAVVGVGEGVRALVQFLVVGFLVVGVVVGQKTKNVFVFLFLVSAFCFLFFCFLVFLKIKRIF